LRNLSKIIENAPNVTALVVGDVMLDRYLWGTVNRISPEAPVPIVNINKTSVVLGGAANVAANVAGLGAKTILFGITGNDTEAKILASSLEKINISSEHLFKSDERQTTIKTRLVAHNQHVVRFDQEKCETLTKVESEEIFQKVNRILDFVTIVIISDYAKGFLTSDFLTRLITLARSKNKYILVDPKGKDFAKYKGVNALTPNRKEAAEATNIEESRSDLIEMSGKKLIKDLSLDVLMITQGEKGITILRRNEENFHFEARARNVYDVTGAGDTVIASFAVAIGADANYVEAAEFANISAGLVVEQLGTTAINVEMIQNALRSENL
jgi:rfaE bifunctional protein kinase chain/domain